MERCHALKPIPSLSVEDASSALKRLQERSSPPWLPVRSREMAGLLEVSLQTLANWRSRGTGPTPEEHVRGQGNRTFYRPDVVIAWLFRLMEESVEPWKISHDWITEHFDVSCDVPNATAVERFIEFCDREKLFSN